MGYAEKYLGIIDTMKTMLATGTYLSNLSGITFGEKSGSQLDPPEMFIVPSVGDVDPSAMPMGHMYQVPLEIVVILYDSDIEAGQRAVIQYAGEAHDVLRQNPTLAGKCLDLVLKSINPGYGPSDIGTVHWCSFSVIAEFEII